MDNYKVDYGQILKNLIMNRCMDNIDEFTIQKELGEFTALVNTTSTAVNAVNHNLTKMSPADVVLLTRIHTPYIHLCKELCEKYKLLGGQVMFDFDDVYTSQMRDIDRLLIGRNPHNCKQCMFRNGCNEKTEHKYRQCFKYRPEFKTIKHKKKRR